MHDHERKRRNLKLTEAGEAACEYYRVRYAHASVFRSRLERLRCVRSGFLEIAAEHAFIDTGFSDTLYSYKEHSPHLTLHLRIGDCNEAVSLVRDDHAHVGLIFGTPRDPQVRARMMPPQPLMAIVSADHELGGRESVTLKELASQYRLALPERSLRIRQLMRSAERAEGVLLQPELVTNSIALLRSFARSGLGVTFLPKFLVRDELASAALKAVHIQTRISNKSSIAVITRIGRQLPSSAQRLISALETHVRILTDA